MPTVEFSFRELDLLLGGGFQPDDLRKDIPMLGVDLENIDHDKVTVEVFPNRPDMLSVEGFARALRGLLDIETGLKTYKVKESPINLFVEDTVDSVRPHITCGIIKAIKLDEDRLKSLMDLQEKLHITHGRNRRKVAIGVHDLGNIKPPLTYKAVKPGEISFKPMDMDTELNLGEILKGHPKGREYAWILEDYDKYPIIVDAEGNVLSFPPIINGELTRVTEKTEDIFIEVTGIDEKAINQALNILTTSICDRGGDIYCVKIKRRR
ncbi:MAG: phenylalanine--tRNA ligase subunit beta [Candidatus Altiarchaeales archaeon]|nr:phenylalanine--tRNA ligase subunit beta [Candidatus Altiarchaeales archaeon]